MSGDIVRRRRKGALPTAICLGHCDIAEAEDSDGKRWYMTWGRRLDSESAGWFAKHTGFRVVCGDELLLWPVDSIAGRWIRHGLDAMDINGPEWEEVKA